MTRYLYATTVLLAGLFLIPLDNAAETGHTVRMELAVATFAGGCFWCTESDFEQLEGVEEVISGYTGGTLENPTYRQVSNGRTGHLESVQVHYDPQRITYEELLSAFWKMIDPTDSGGQFVDRGHQYTTAIFTHNAEQKRLAERAKRILENSRLYDKPVVTVIRDASSFYPAEDHHQNYYRKNPLRYRFYRWNSGRDDYLEGVWGSETLHH